MDGQQVFVTGADGEQMVLSGPEAAALLAQAGISIGENDQVIIGDHEGSASLLSQMQEEGAHAEQAEDEGGIIQVPEGSSVHEDGSIVAADGTVLAPPGSVIIGEDGTLMMTQDGAMLMQSDQQGLGCGQEPADGQAYHLVEGEQQQQHHEEGMTTTDSGGGEACSDETTAVPMDGENTLQENSAEQALTPADDVPVNTDTAESSNHTKTAEEVATAAEENVSGGGCDNNSSDIAAAVAEQQSGESVAEAVTAVQGSTSFADEHQGENQPESMEANAADSDMSAGEPAETPNMKVSADLSAAASEAHGSEVHQQEAVMYTSAEATMIQEVYGRQSIYTTADGTVVSAPEGTLMANAEGNLVTADGTVLTTEDGLPVSLHGSILSHSETGSSVHAESMFTNSEALAGLAVTRSASLSSTAGGIVVTAAGGTIMSDGAYLTTSEASILPNTAHEAGLLTSEDGVINAPEGSVITEDGSLVAADGTVLAPPGSVVAAEDTGVQQEHQQELSQQQHIPSGNLIGLQLPDENGEVLYLDPNDPAAQMLLQEAGITLGEGGVLQTADGQILTNEDGNPITSNLGQQAKNNLVGDAVAAAGLGADDLGFQLPTNHSVIDLPITANHAGTEIRPDLPVSSGFEYVSEAQEHKASKHIFQPRYSTISQQVQQPVQQQKFQKLTFNSAAAYGTTTAGRTTITAGAQRRQQQQQMVQRTVQPQQQIQRKTTTGGSDLQIGPDQQKVTYTVTSENGYSQTYMMICSKSLDQNTLINTLIKNIASDPNHRGKKTIKITQHKYGTKKQKPPRPTQPRPSPQVKGVEPLRGLVQHQQQARPQYKTIQQQQPQPLQPHQHHHQQQLDLVPAVEAVRPPQPPQQILQSEADMAELITSDPIPENLSLDDIVSQIGAGEGADNEPRVIVKCAYCTSFKSVLNSQTWENILNHILPVAKEELHASFYGNILKNFSRGLKVGVSGKGDFCEVTVTHGLVCRRTGAWYSVDRPGVELATQLATHIAAVQPGVSGPYGARPRGNSLICLFCSSPYTAEDYQRHLKPHQDFIIPCLLLAAGAYCANSFETDIKKASACDTCRELEYQDLRFLPCTKFASEFNCGKKLQATVDCFRENFDSRGFLQVSNSAMTKCSVCRTQNQTYCALFRTLNHSLLTPGSEMLAVCANCQKQFVNVVMRENSFDKQLKMFQLHHMEQLCGMLRVLLSSSTAICSGRFDLLYTVQEGGSLYTASNTVHTVVPARALNYPPNSIIKGLRLEENKSIDLSGPQLKFVCDQCKFSIDLTRLQHSVGKTHIHLVDMSLGIILEHIVPHTDSLLAVIMTSATNEIFQLKFEFSAQVEGEGASRRINVMLDRKIILVGMPGEIPVQKDIYKTVEVLKAKIKQDKKGNICMRNRYIFVDSTSEVSSDNPITMECSKFLDQADPVLKLYGASGCNTRLLDYYSECRLCSKFSFPDFRLTAAIKRSEGVSLCENCSETIVSLCVPSEPERIPGRGEQCLLLNQERNTGHRLVLSNQTKKWISADGVEKIQLVSEVAAAANIPDFSTRLVQLFKSHMLAVCERSWSDPDCVLAKAGFVVQDQGPFDSARIPPIEVKVSLRPPKPKTPPPKLVITPVMSKAVSLVKGSPSIVRSVGGSTLAAKADSSKLVKITANRRIIPVRDPTSISSPVREKLLTPKEISTQEKVAALREALHASARIAESKSSLLISNNTTKATAPATKPAPPAATSPSASAVPEGKEEEDEEFETLEDIANFINSSEPLQKEPGHDDSRSDMFTLQDEFTDTTLGMSSQDSTKVYKLPKGTIVTNVSSPDGTAIHEVPLPAEAEPEDDTPVRIPSNLKISEVKVGVVRLQAGVGPRASEAKGGEKQPGGGSGGQKEALPSPASDATTSTRSTPTTANTATAVTPSIKPTPKGRPQGGLNKPIKPPIMPRLLPRADQLETSDAASSSNSKKAGQSPLADSLVKKALKKAVAKKEALLLDQEMEHLTAIDLDYEIGENDLEDIDDDEDFTATPRGDRKTVKLSSLLPKPTPKTTPKTASATSSGRRGRPKGSVVRKRQLEEGTPEPTAKKAKEEEPEFQRVIGGLRCEMCEVSFLRLDCLQAHLLIHSGEQPFVCKLCGKAYMRKGAFKNHTKTHMFGADASLQKIIEIDVGAVEGAELDQDETPEYLKGKSMSGRVRKAKKMFDL